MAAARALIGSPELIVADEPTSALDRDRQAAFLDLLFTEAGQAGATLIMVSHDESLAPRFDRVVRLDEIATAGPGERRMIVLRLALQSLRNRWVTALLTVLAIAVSITLLLGVEKVRTGARQSFADTISGTDLIVGARSGSLNLLLYSVFRIGNATNNITWASYQDIAARPGDRLDRAAVAGRQPPRLPRARHHARLLHALQVPPHARPRASAPASRSPTCSMP